MELKETSRGKRPRNNSVKVNRMSSCLRTKSKKQKREASENKGREPSPYQGKISDFPIGKHGSHKRRRKEGWSLEKEKKKSLSSKEKREKGFQTIASLGRGALKCSSRIVAKKIETQS